MRGDSAATLKRPIATSGLPRGSSHESSYAVHRSAPEKGSGSPMPSVGSLRRPRDRKEQPRIVPVAVCGGLAERGIFRLGHGPILPRELEPPPVADRLGHVACGDRLHAREVGDRARELEHAMVGARREPQPGDRLLEQRLPGGSARQWRSTSFVPSSTLGLPCRASWRARAAATRSRTTALPSAGSSASSSAWGTAGTSMWISMRSRSGPEDSTPVARDLVGSTAASPAVMSEVAAGARIHRRDELEARGEVAFAQCARDRHASRLERLAQDLEHAAVELRQLVEEQDTPVRKRNLARPGVAATTDEREAGSRMVRGAERSLPPLLDLKASAR